jgi:hypothetical protein
VKNEYEVRGDTTAIFLERRDGTRLECLVDTEDLSRFNSIRKITAHFDIKSGNYYAVFYKRKNVSGYKYTEIPLHRFIIFVDSDLEVDHINRNTLDNRERNLRPVTHPQNMQNRSIYTNNKSGVRGVHWHKRQEKWIASIRVDGKLKHIGSFNTVDEAEQAVKEARRKYMPFSEE